MATKLQFYQAVADKTIHELTAHGGNWIRFLDTAAQLYKYPFQDQLMIYAQRPEATACAELELWNEKFSRWVRKGSKGIALIDDSGNYPRLKYVFDVSDTEASLYRARPVQLWRMTQEHKSPVLSELAKNYEDIDTDGTLANAFRSIATQLAHEYYEDNYREILYSTENSVLEPPIHYDASGSAIEDVDDSALHAAFEQSLANSIAYTIMTRCELDTAEHFDVSDFQSVIDFNTPDMVHALGVATAELSEQVLRDIEITIRKYERVKNAERSEQDYDRNPYLQPSGRLSTPGHQTERAADGGNGTSRQIRENEESVPQGSQKNNIQQAPVVGETVSASEGSGRSGEPEIRADNDISDGANQPAGQSYRPDEVDGGDEHVESTSRGSHSERIDLRIEPEPPESPTLTLSQFETIPIKELLSTSPISMDEVDSILRDGGNFDSRRFNDKPFDSRSALRIAAHFAKGLPGNAEYLKHEYLMGQYGRSFTESGKGFDFAGPSGTSNHRVCAWYGNDGITLAIGTTAKNNIHRITIPWESAAARIDALIRSGQYVSREVFENAIQNERLELADKLWNFYRDDMGGIPDEWKGESFGHPEDIAKIKSLLDNENERKAILNRLEADVAAWKSNPENRTWHNPSRLLDEMNNAMHPHFIFPTDEFTHKRNFSYFITQDEIDAVLTHGGNYSEGKFRFLSFFLGDHNEKEKLDFVKREYGHGGGTWNQTDGWQNAEPGKGLSIQRGSIGNPDAEVNLKWNAVIKRTEQLISTGQYMTRAELDRVPNYERLMLMRQLQAFYRDLPEEYNRPFAELDFHYPHEAEWEALRNLLDSPENVEALLASMKPIYLNTIAEDRYYNTRKAAWDNLIAYRDGEYTLFPGIENIPEPGTPTIQRFNEPSVSRETVIDLNDSPSPSDFLVNPSETEQMTLFEASPLPILPSVEKQRAKIDETLKQEAETVIANADAPFLSISDANKERIATQFTTAPRSREAATIIKEIYGDSLNMPLPQAVKRIMELVAEGKFTTAPEITAPLSRRQVILTEINAIKVENNSAMVAYQIGDFYEMYGEDARIAADTLDLTLVTLHDLPEVTHMVGFPSHLIGENARILNEAGHALVVSSERENGTRSMFVYPTMEAVSAVEPPQVNADGKRAYAVGDSVWIENRHFVISSIGDRYKQPDDLDRRFNMFGRNIRLNDTTDGYPIGRVMYQSELDSMLGLDERNTHLLPLGGEPEPAAPEAEQSVETFVESGTETINETPIEQEAPQYNFDALAAEIYQQVLNDSQFAEVLANATSRGALRRTLGGTLDSVIAGYESETAMYVYLTGDDVTDNLFDYIYRKAWDERETTPEPPKPDYVKGSRLILDLRGGFLDSGLPDPAILAGEFIVEEIDGYNITLGTTYSRDEDNTHSRWNKGSNNERYAVTLTTAEIEAYKVNPVIEKLNISPSETERTDYYILRYPDGIDAGAGLSVNELSLITEKADAYVICSEASYLSDEQMQENNISFRKMPRDWNLLPEMVQNQIRAIMPIYEQKWNEMYGQKEVAPQPMLST